MNKRVLILLTAMLLVLATGCGNNTNASDNKKIKIVTTIFPEYDWVREISKGNDNIELVMLLDKGVDLHNFQPTADDIINISTCDVFIYVGGESDSWVEDCLSDAKNKNMQVINLMEVLNDSVREEEIVEGMQSEEEEIINASEAKGDINPENEEKEYDEHVWLSVRNAKLCCMEISKVLQTVDSENKTLYEDNLNSYIAELSQVDEDYCRMIENSDNKTLLFGDRFPFRYMAEDYGLKYYAAFSGCAAEVEASFETVTFLANKINEEDLGAVMILEGSDGKLAQTIIDNSKRPNCEIISINSMQSVTAEDVKNGAKYIEIMKKNLEAIKKAL